MIVKLGYICKNSHVISAGLEDKGYNMVCWCI